MHQQAGNASKRFRWHPLLPIERMRSCDAHLHIVFRAGHRRQTQQGWFADLLTCCGSEGDGGNPQGQGVVGRQRGAVHDVVDAFVQRRGRLHGLRERTQARSRICRA